MTAPPDDTNELIIHKTQLSPDDPKDKRTTWQKFVDGLRQTIGLKPLRLVERWAEARVRKDEVETELRLLEAKGKYEFLMARVRKMDRESLSAQGLTEAKADFIRSKSTLSGDVPDALKTLIDSASSDPADTLEELKDVIRRIEIQGGTVEFDLPERGESTAGGGSSK